MKASDIRKGNVIKYNNRIVRVLSATHHTPGNLRAMVQMEMKDLERGTKLEHRFRSDDTVEKVNVELHAMEYLYKEGDAFVFMNGETYEQISLPNELVGDSMVYVLPNSKIDVAFVEEKPIYIELPQKVTLKVVETEPGIKNATATNVNKPATMETGLVVGVPPFVNTGDSIIISTETGEYVSRA